MIIVAKMSDKRILSRYEAWDSNALDDAAKYIVENGYTFLNQEITLMGDMIIWVQ